MKESERPQHEATGRHKGNLKRFLRGIQNDHDKDEREKQRAKSEVQRLNRAVGGASLSAAPPSAQSFRRGVPTSGSQASVADSERQMAQLAQMGVALPDDCRGQMALAGDWQVVSQKSVGPGQEIEKGDPPSVGIRKRMFEGTEEEEGAEDAVKKKGWGSTRKQYPVCRSKDLDALLAGSLPATKGDSSQTLKQEVSSQPADTERVYEDVGAQPDTSGIATTVQVKQEDPSGGPANVPQVPEHLEEGSLEPLVAAFKKRKSKAPVKNDRPFHGIDGIS